MSRRRALYRACSAFVIACPFQGFDIGTSHDVEPLMLAQYSPGVEFIVRNVRIDRDRVRLHFHKVGQGDLATTLTVKWPTPLSDELTESSLIDAALARFVTRVESVGGND